MPPNDKAGRVVFIGNIPYGGTEEIVVETLSRVGPVLNFRLVYDKETGRPKGFGFAEFVDSDSAASAVRNLNDFDLMGRKLRVDWSNDNGAGDNAPAGMAPSNMNGQAEASAPAQQAPPLPPLPPGADVPPGLTCPDAISRTLSTLPTPQLLDIISQMKGLVMSDPAKATELLRQAPQLAYAIFQALLLLGLVDSSVLGSLVDQSAPPAAAPAQAPPPAATPVQAVPPPRAPPGYAGYPPQPVPTPTQPQGYGQPPPQAAPPAMTVEQQQAQAYAQVMAMSQEQIDMLEPNVRAQILQIRQMLMGTPRA